MEELKNKLKTLEERLLHQQAVLQDHENQIEARRTAYASLLQKISQDMLLPLNGIIAASQSSQATALSTKQEKDKGDILQSINNLMSVVQGMSVLSAMFRNELRPDIKEFSFKRLFSELISAHQLLMPSKNLELKHIFLSDLPEFMEGDYTHLKLILSGLLSNAVKNTRDGWIHLSAENIKKVHEKMVIRLKVTDSGKGIGKDKQAQIRASLEKSDVMEMLLSEKVGMGLVLAHKLAAKLDGQFNFDSEAGVGSSFWIDIPLKPVRETGKIIKSENQMYTSLRKRKILLVEDNYINQKLVGAALLKAGHSIEIAENGKVALEKYRSRAYDLILMDIQMPLVDGLETTKIIRKEEKKYKKARIPIVAVTAYAIEYDKQKCFEAGMDRYLTKPFKSLELLKIIDNL